MATSNDITLPEQGLAHSNNSSNVSNTTLPEAAISAQTDSGCGNPDQQEKFLQQTTLRPPLDVDETLIGKHVVVLYDGLPYPGVVKDVDENDIEVKVMHKAGVNRYYWPSPLEDICWYEKENVLTVLESEPQHVTGRHCQIDPITWKLIANRK
ncbi:hypothetical protein ACF0H5_010708 [Mactra antiquata]